MKNLSVLIFLCSCVIVSAQDLNTWSAAPGKYKSLQPQELSLTRETVFWEEDFENGIPVDWSTGDAGAIAYWEYRGPGTDPNNEIGTRGSCLPEGSPGGAPIQSTSWSNGFVIFDSNWWDDPEGPCGNMGSGPAPAPHDAWLELPSMDFTAHPKIGLIFSQYAKDYAADMKVEVSANNGPWIEVFIDELIVNQSTPLTDEQRVNISPQAGGISDVKIRFVFSGTYYFWMLDDIRLVDLDDNNMHADHSTYGDYDFYDPDHPTGFEYLEYGQYPDEMAPELKFTTFASNFGALAQTDVRLHVEVKNDSGTQIHDAISDEGFTVQTGDEIELRAGDYQMPSTIDEYMIRFEVIQEEEEQAPDDNMDTLNFRITDAVYARDRGPAEGVFIPLETFNGSPYEVGNMYMITAGGIQAHSISVGVSVGTITPSTVYGVIYEIFIEKTLTVNLIATTDAVSITADDLNNYGDEHLITLPFSSPVSLQNGHAYLVMAGSEDGPGMVLFSYNGISPELATWVRFEQGVNDGWNYLAEIAMVRLNTGPFVSMEESSVNDFLLSCFPSPAQDFTELIFDLPVSETVELTVLGTNGELIVKEKLTGRAGRNSKRLDTASWASGVYSMRISGETASATSRLMVIR